MNPETLALTVFHFSLHNENGLMEAKGIAGIGIKEWNEDGIKFNIDFTNPLDVSTGQNLDKLEVSMRPGSEKYFKTESG